MQTHPLAPTGGILTILQPLAGTPVHSLALWTLGAGVIVWTLYTLVIAYHWFRYSHGSTIAVPAIATHLIVSLFLAMYAFSAFLNL